MTPELWTPGRPRASTWLQRLRRWRSGIAGPAAAGDVMLDASGNVILDASGNVLLDDGAGNACCCGLSESPGNCCGFGNHMSFTLSGFVFSSSCAYCSLNSSYQSPQSYSGSINGTYDVFPAVGTSGGVSPCRGGCFLGSSGNTLVYGANSNPCPVTTFTTYPNCQLNLTITATFDNATLRCLNTQIKIDIFDITNSLSTGIYVFYYNGSPQTSGVYANQGSPRCDFQVPTGTTGTMTCTILP